MQRWQGCLVLMCLVAMVFLATGCATHTRYATYDEDDTSIERPARALDEEEGLADRIGELGIVLLVVVVAVGGILVPLIFLGAL